MNRLDDLLAFGLARRDQEELIDAPGLETNELEQNLRDMSRVNWFGGGVALSAWALEQFVYSVQPDRRTAKQLLVLDIGSGIGDIPRAFTRRRGVQVIASDISPQIVRIAAGTNQPGAAAIAYAAANGLRLPFGDQTVDVAHCSFALHHFTPDLAVACLREMRRVAHLGLIVNDLVRSWPGIGGAWLFGRLASANRLTRHDGLVSARRAYTLGEIRDLAEQAGLHVAAQRVLAGYRAVLVLK